MYVKTRISPQAARDFLRGRKQGKFLLARLGSTVFLKQSGNVRISVPNVEVGKKALAFVKNLEQSVKVGSQFHALVTKVLPFGAFALFTPHQEGLIHISEMPGWTRENRGSAEAFVSLGDVIPVSILEINSMGRVNLSGKPQQG